MNDLTIFSIFGFLIIFVERCLGNAYGTALTSMTTAFGIPVVNATSAVHFFKIFLRFESAFNAFVNKKFDFELLKRLFVPAALGGFWCSFLIVITQQFDIRPLAAVYFLCLGVLLIIDVKRPIKFDVPAKMVGFLGLIGAFLDSIGGGWGQIISKSNNFKGYSEVKVAGTIDIVEVLVSVIQSAVFLSILGLVHWRAVLGLFIGMTVGLPVVNLFLDKIKRETAQLVVGSFIVLLNIYVFVRVVFKLKYYLFAF